MKGRQTLWASIVEAKTNILIGAGVAYTTNLLILPLFGFDSLNAANNLAITAIYTGVSIVRQFLLRRFFNSLKWGHSK